MSQLLREDLEDCLARTTGLWDELRGQRIFITGATGFFGCWLLESLLWANRRLDLNTRVTILSRNPAALKDKAPHLAADPALEVVTGDVKDFRLPPGSFSHIIHAATSSGAVYGTQPTDIDNISEESTCGPDPLHTASAYAEGKRAAELLCAMASHGNASRATALQPKIARCFAFVGPYMKLDAHFAIGNFIRDQLRGSPIRVAGDGTPLRSYMYAGELMVWLWTILFRGTPLRAYNVGSEQAVSIRDLAHRVAQSLSPEVPVEISGTPGSAPAQRYVPSTQRAQRELGLSCQVPLNEAIRRTHRWCLQTGLALESAR
jgi:nucleoside-diphosphate-sugar epimerase